MHLNDDSRLAWAQFICNTSNAGHAERVLHGSDIDSHVSACWASAQATAGRIQQDIGPLNPKKILEVGASTGLNSYALAQFYPDADVIGIEPEEQAVAVANSMKQVWPNFLPVFEAGYGEALPLDDASVDLIICHTVIEHVRDVPKVIAEMSRVLALGGVIHLEAPNYIWPYEPHLGVWCVPLFGKAFVRTCARLQGKGNMLDFLNHLQFVHPKMLENLFTRHGLAIENRATRKIAAAFSGNTKDVKAYKKLATVMHAASFLGFGRFMTHVLVKLGFYPSVLYTLRKDSRT